MNARGDTHNSALHSEQSFKKWEKQISKEKAKRKDLIVRERVVRSVQDHLSYDRLKAAL